MEIPLQHTIKMEDLSYFVDGRIILDKVSFVLEKGVNRTILGASGCGKTTILRLLLGLLQPDSGRVFIEGRALDTLSEHDLTEVRKKISIVFQGGALFDSMTVGKMSATGCCRKGSLPIRKLKLSCWKNLAS
jgi:phospholipid/cholesterol/gamma-HCH transport system ATP-binding protein